MNNISDAIKKQRLYFDGGAGTYLQKRGLPRGTAPEIWNTENPSAVTDMHREYLSAGCNIITTNTFGINALKYPCYAEMIKAGIQCAKNAVQGRENTYIAYDIGPCGRLLEPIGDLPFEDATELFAKNVRVAAECGVDLFIIETMCDSYETKAAVLAVKENSDLPVFVTNVYNEDGKLMTGATPEAMTALLEGLGADAIGLNCSLSPDKMSDIVERLAKYASVPIIAMPNAGIPAYADGEAVYCTDAETYAEEMAKLADKGACILGGCCGTTPEYMKRVIERTRGIPYSLPAKKELTLVSSYTHAVLIGDDPIIIGERINPTGKKKIKDALQKNDIDQILSEGIAQVESGAHILDVNVGLPEINEAEMMKNVVSALQSVTDVPLQIDSADAHTLEVAMRIYNGKPLINSVSGDEASMNTVFPLVKKYGGAVIALTMDENGIPESPDERAAIAKRIIIKAEEYGISKSDIIVDPLALTISSNQDAARTALDTVSLLYKMGIRTSLGVSNISFGLPKREIINATFYAAALERGLSCAILNPLSQDMMNIYHAFRALNGHDTACEKYIRYSDSASADNTPAPVSTTLRNTIISGMAHAAAKMAKEMLAHSDPISIIDGHIIPALDEIGAEYECKRAYLPQLMMSAEAASAAFNELRHAIPHADGDGSRKMILATVKGDIHDIGKNIVKVLLESYGYSVIDLGRDVSPKAICDAVTENGCDLVGLSALMTTTVASMAETVRALRELDRHVTVVAGGAVLTEEYAKMIGADAYAADAMDTVRLAEKFYRKVR